MKTPGAVFEKGWCDGETEAGCSGIAENPGAPLQGIWWGPFENAAYKITLILTSLL